MIEKIYMKTYEIPGNDDRTLETFITEQEQKMQYLYSNPDSHDAELLSAYYYDACDLVN